MRLWVTRTQPQAQATAERLRHLGHEPLVLPVLAARPISSATIDLAGAGALAFSSQAGVETFAAICPRRDLAVFTTGDATARAARSAGFADVHSAGGGIEALARLIATTNPAGAVVWPCALEPAGDLAALLAPAGVAVRPQPVYETTQTDVAAPAAIDGVIVHSPKAARRVAVLLAPEAARALILFAISPAAAAPLASLPFASVAIAGAPDEAALLSLIEGGSGT